LTKQKKKVGTEEGEFATAFQPIQVAANLEAVHHETAVGGVLGSLQEKFRGGDAVIADEVSRKRNL